MASTIAKIQNEELAELINASRGFNSLPHQTQEAYIKRISRLEESDIPPLIKFFKEENEAELKEELTLSEEKLASLQELYEQALNLERQLKKYILQNHEKASDQEDEAKLATLLDQLENN